MNKIRDLLHDKKALVIASAVLLLAAAAVTAALTGLFGGVGKNIDAATGDPGTTADSPGDTVRYAELLDSIVEIAPSDQDSLGVSTTSAFRLLFSRDTDEKAVASALNIEPKQDFSITRVSGNEFSLEFSEPWKATGSILSR